MNQGKECNPITSHCLTINSMSIIVINGRTMFKDYILIVEYNVIYRDSMYIQWVTIVYSIVSLCPPVIPRKDTLSPRYFLFFSLYPVTAAHRVPMRDFDLHHAGKERIARFPITRQGIFWIVHIIQGKRKEKRHGSFLRSWLCVNVLRVHHVEIEKVNKITPLYIMSKNGGICSVNLKKNIKIFLNVQIAAYAPFRNHPYHLV